MPTAADEKKKFHDITMKMCRDEPIPEYTIHGYILRQTGWKLANIKRLVEDWIEIGDLYRDGKGMIRVGSFTESFIRPTEKKTATEIEADVILNAVPETEVTPDDETHAASN